MTVPPIAAVIVSLVWAAGHVYVAYRLVQPLTHRPWLRTALYGLFVLMYPLTPQIFVAPLWLDDNALTIARWVGWSYMGWFSIIVALVAVRDVVSLLLKLADRDKGRVYPASDERRRFLMSVSGTGAFGIASTLGVRGMAQAREGAQVVEVEVPIEGLPAAFEGYRIAQISDIHVGQTIDDQFIVPIIEQVSALEPDMVAVTGDVVDGSVLSLKRDVAPLAYLRAPDGVFGVTGNHEYYSGAEQWCEEFERLGIKMLLNAHHVIERDGARLLIAGVTDYRASRHLKSHTSSPEKALKGAPKHDAKVLLAHQPRSAFEAAKHGFDLQLSGHTHGGQYFPYNLAVYLAQPVAKGLAKIDGMWVYVNSGTCYWGPPMRTGVPAEVTLVKLTRATSSD